MFMEKILPYMVDSSVRALELMMLCRGTYLFSRTWSFWSVFMERVLRGRLRYLRQRSRDNKGYEEFARVLEIVYKQRPQVVLSLFTFKWPTEDGQGLPLPLTHGSYDVNDLGPHVGPLRFDGDPRAHPDVCIVRSTIEFERDEFPRSSMMVFRCSMKS